MTIPDINKLNGAQLKENFFKLHYPDFYSFITNKYDIHVSFQEKLYLYYNKMNSIPVCKICGNNVKFINSKEGYRIYCSRKCMNSDPDKINNTKNTNKLKYGGNAPICSDEIKSKIQATLNDKYGVDNIMKLSSIVEKNIETRIEKYGGVGNASDILKQKQEQTCLNKYGVKYASQTENFKNKLIETNLRKFGYKTAMNTESSMMKSKTTKLKKIQSKYPDVINYDDEYNWICACPHPGCDKCDDKYYVTTSQIYRGRLKDNTEPCTNILPINPNNNKNTSIEIFIKNILDENNINYISNDRHVLNGKELDIYIPDKNLAIECNGIYSHSSKYKDSKYHYNKYKDCLSKNIQLITLWEDQIKNTPDIVKSLLLSKLGIFDIRIGARKCTVKEIDFKTCFEFLNNNHIQGACQSKVRLGLYYNNNLVSVMTFGNPIGCSGNKNNKSHILKRFCSLKGWQIIGGANKLLQFYIKKYNPDIIESFACNDISNGNLYKKLGFIETHHNASYWYIKGMKRYHRSTFTKDAIVKKGWKPINDYTWTESEVMKEQGYYKIYDCGQTKYIYKKENRS